ncbi:hypothetical protein MSP7336_01108 [Mycobacterium shimoidei]|uniref:Uncharacterized protein n=1 Tax=Mycobacterium shimoidei TaxID=29313 RepID=A0A375YVL3_MYCSH|nr:hypothetical protein MSP7336_01108 [Mycobacterium shimoidei]
MCQLPLLASKLRSIGIQLSAVAAMCRSAAAPNQDEDDNH